MCHNTYEEGWSDEEAREEAKSIFGKPVEDWKSGSSVVCDDCFNSIHPNKNPEQLAYARENI